MKMSGLSRSITATLLFVLLSMGDLEAASHHYKKKTVTLATFNTALTPYHNKFNGTDRIAERTAALIQKV